MNFEPKLARWLRWLVYASALVPLVIFAQYMSPFHFGKVIVFRIIVEAMVGLYLILAWRDRSYLPKSHPITWAFLAFTLAFTLTTITSVAPLQSWWGTIERMGGLFTFWHYFAFYVIAISVMRTRDHWRTLLDLMIAVGLVSAVYGFLQKTSWSAILGSGGRARPFGTIGNAALFAGYQLILAYLAGTLLLMKRFGPAVASTAESFERGAKIVGGGLGSALILALLFKDHGLWLVAFGPVFYGIYVMMAAKGKARWFTGTSMVLMFIAVATTAVRGSLLGIAVATVVFALLWSVLNRSRRGKLLLLGTVGTVVVLFFLALSLRSTSLVKNSPYLTRVTDFSSSTFTVQTRFWAWSAGFKGWSEEPRYMAVGWGPENFNIPFSKYFNPKFFTGPGAETFFDRAHNMFIEVLVTMGIVGLLTYLALFGILFRTLARYMRAGGELRILGIGFTAMTVAYIIHNSFIFDTSANFITFFTLLAFVVHIGQRGIEGDQMSVGSGVQQGSTAGSWGKVHSSAAVALVFAICYLIYGFNIKPAVANFATTRAIVAGWTGGFFNAVGKYRESIGYDTAGRYEYRHRFAQYILEVSTVADTSKIPNFNQIVEEAIAEVEKNAKENPRDYLPMLYISRLYIVLGRSDAKSPYNDRALEYSAKALEISPTFVRTYYEVAQAYLNKKDYAKAFEAFERAVELQPDVGATYWYMGLVKIQAGQIDQGLALVNTATEKGYVLTEGDTQRLLNAYLQLRDFKKVAALYEQLVEKFPTKKEYWEQLAAAYIEAGQREQAIDAIRRGLAAVGTDAQFRARAINTLRSLGVTP
jgi:tetratricopeptide (TPR) repeat protein/O-antigen ligase